MKKYLLGIVVITMSIFAQAAPRSIKEAAEIAAEFTNHQPQLNNNMRRAPRKATDMQFAHRVSKPQSDDAALYIFNQADNGGFVIVSADDNAVTILGYSDEGTFNSTHIPANVQWWLDYYAERVAKAQPASNKAKRAPKGDKTPVLPLLRGINWSQDAPYYDMCPIDQWKGERSASGCVATAGAQIMRYWKWPVQGQGSHSYTWHNCIKRDRDKDCMAARDTVLSADFGATVYDWDNMLGHYNGDETEEQNHAVAELMYHVGVASEMGYSSLGSGTGTDDLGKALVNYFGYKNTARYYSQYDDPTLTHSRLATMFEAELQAGRPITMGGANDHSAHEFVCDGINEDGLFHINWGWGGYYNGYFALTALNPDGQGIGGSEEGLGYSKHIDCVIGIEPERNPIHVTSIAMSQKSASLKIRESIDLSAAVAPNDATNTSVEWKSTNKDIVDVSSSGKVIGVSAGTAYIIATTNDGGISDSCAVTILDECIPPVNLTVNYAHAYYRKEKHTWYISVQGGEAELPWVQFEIKSYHEDKIAGTYNLTEGRALCYLTDDYKGIYSTKGYLNLTCAAKIEGYPSCNYYHIKAEFIGDDYKQYSLYTTTYICAEDLDFNNLPLNDNLGDGYEGITTTPIKPNTNVQKILENGQVIIVRGDEKFTVFGQKIQ